MRDILPAHAEVLDMAKLLRVLIIEDAQDDADLLAMALQSGGYQVEYQRVDTPRAVRKALAASTWDAIIADYVVPGFGGLQALAVVKKQGVDLPFIMVSGKVGEEEA